MTAPALNSPWIAFAQPSTQARLRLLCLPLMPAAAPRSTATGAVAPRRAPAQRPSCPDAAGACRALVHPAARAGGRAGPGDPAAHPAAVRAVRPQHGGALIALELARELRRAGAAAPRHLFVSGHRAPQLPDPDRPIHALPYAEFVDELRQLNGTPAELLEQRRADALARLRNPLRADFELCEQYAYTPGAPLDCPISAFGGLSDPHAARDQIEPARRRAARSTRGFCPAITSFCTPNGRRCWARSPRISASGEP